MKDPWPKFSDEVRQPGDNADVAATATVARMKNEAIIAKHVCDWPEGCESNDLNLGQFAFRLASFAHGEGESAQVQRHAAELEVGNYI